MVGKLLKIVRRVVCVFYAFGGPPLNGTEIPDLKLFITLVLAYLKKKNLQKLNILRKFKPPHWPLKVSWRAPGPISQVLGPNGLVPAQVTSTSSPKVRPTPSRKLNPKSA